MQFELIPDPKDRNPLDFAWTPPEGIRLISADDHNMEAEHLWEDRLPEKFRDRAPKLWHDENGWNMEIEGRSLNVPGISTDISEGCEGFWNRDERLKAMDAEHVDAQVIYHGRLQSLNMLKDDELYTACMDVYNEWLAEFCKPAENRLIGVPMCPTYRKPEATRDYMQKLKDLGFKAMQIPSFPRDVRYNSREFEPLWSAIEEAAIPLSFHIGAYLQYHGHGSLGANLTYNLGPYRGLLGQLVFSGVLERHPGLKVIFTEGGAGWAAQTINDMDLIFREYNSQLRPKLAELPSFYWKRQCYATFMYDPAAIRCIDMIGEDNIMWSLDYPHAEGCYGYAGKVTKEIYDELGHERAAKVLGGTAAKVWDIPALN